MKDFAAIDFELANGVITSACSVGVVIVRDGEIVDTFYSLIRPEPNYYHWYCRKVNKLGRKFTDSAPLFPEVWRQVAPRLEGLVLVAHNKQFEERVLRALHKHYSMPYPGYRFLCTLIQSRRVWQEGKHNLDVIAERCGFPLQNHHNALADAEACAWIAREIL